jgi:hypothetical protein
MVLIVLMFLLLGRIRACCSVCVWHMQRGDCYFLCNGGAPYIVYIYIYIYIYIYTHIYFHLNRRVRQFSRLLAAEVCASTVVMLGTPCSEVVWRVLANHSISQFPFQFPSCASPCAITFQLDSTFHSVGCGIITAFTNDINVKYCHLDSCVVRFCIV